MKIHLGTPTYKRLDAQRLLLRARAARATTHRVVSSVYGNSLLPLSFNGLLASARIDEAHVFAMLHADIRPEPGWLQKMLDVFEARKLSCLSAVVRIRENTGRTSTAIEPLGYKENRETLRLRHLHAEDVLKLPDVFTQEDVQSVVCNGERHGALLVNTGIMLMRLADFEDFPGFNIVSGFHDTGHKTWVDSEDCELSRWMHRRGMAYAAMSSIENVHYTGGEFVWSTKEARA